MQCPKCGNASVKPGQKFCMKCGYRFETPAEPKNVETVESPVCCPKCGKPAIKPGQKFCLSCGTPMASAPTQQPDNGEKGILRDAANFVRGGHRAVEQGRRRQKEERLRQEAERLGYDVNKPNRNNDNHDNNDGRSNTQYDEPQQQTSRRLVVDTNSVEGVSVVSGRAIWNIEKGQLARMISEAELANADGLKGVIVQEGCSALVFIDGTLVANMEAGAYTFPAKSDAERKLEEVQKEIEREQKELDKQQAALEAEQRKRDAEYAKTFRARGVFGELAAFGRGVMGFLFGHKQGDKPEQHKKKTEQRAQKIKAIPMPKVCRVYIVSNRAINMVLNSKVNEHDEISFVPFKVKTKLVDIDVAVTMQLQISNIHQFATNYLADQKSVSTFWLQQLLAPMVQQTLTQLLRNFDYQQEGLPEPVIINLKTRIQQTLNDYLKGIEVIRVFEITDNSADFDRFRAVQRELFATEKELGFLQRTNEFKNRLEQEQNKVIINHASNEESLRQALQAINKDKLLSEDEMDQFVMLQRAQKRLRDSKDFIDAAKIKEEEYEAISDLKKCHLVKDDEVAALENTLAQGKIDRENVTEIMRVQALQKLEMARQIAEFELSDNRMEHDMAAELRKAQHQGNLAAAQIDAKRLIDMYNDERNEFEWNRDFTRYQQQENYEFSRRQQETELEWQQRQREHEMSRQDKFDDLDILDREANIAMRNMQAMKEAELRKLQEENRSHETIEINRMDNFANMSAEQIRAAQLDRLTGDAQVAMANAYSKDGENELLKQQAEDAAKREREQREAAAKDKEDLMNFAKEMAGMIKDTATNVGGAQLAAQRERADEYREDAQRQQNRMDRVVDQSLNYTTRAHQTDSQSFAQAMGGSPRGFQQNTPQQPQAPVTPQPEVRICPECGAEVPADESFCGECGHRMN